MASRRIRQIPGFSIDRVAGATNNDPDVLRMENLDTDLPPPTRAVESTRTAIGRDEDNSYLPFIGRTELREEIARKITQQTNKPYHRDQVVITSGATEGMLDVLFALTDPGDEVILTDPTYAGMIYRVRLVGAVPKLVPFQIRRYSWRLDLDRLEEEINPRTKALFIMNPSMPSGAVLSMQEWKTITKLCIDKGLWLIYNAAMERILFDNRKVIHPATFLQMQGRTIIIGSVSKESRMIGWRVGWVVAPEPIISEIAKAHIYNVVTPPGIAQMGALAAIGEKKALFRHCLEEWQQRRDTVVEQLGNYKMIPAAGGWSQLLDTSPLGHDAKTASQILLTQGKVAATPMDHWGQQNSRQFLRLVFSNETVDRLNTLGERFYKAFGR